MLVLSPDVGVFGCVKGPPISSPHPPMRTLDRPFTKHSNLVAIRQRRPDRSVLSRILLCLRSDVYFLRAGRRRSRVREQFRLLVGGKADESS